MRLKSSIFVSAILRQEQASGAFATILKKGAEDAGAIFFVHLKQTAMDVYAPAPQMFFSKEETGDRQFELRLEDVNQSKVDEFLTRQTAFDPDCWIVEIEKAGLLNSITIIDVEN